MKNLYQEPMLRLRPVEQEHRTWTLANALAITDAELVTEVAARSESALNVLLARHSPLLRTVIHRVMNDGGEVDEVLQDVFLYIWNHAEAYSEKKGRFIGWLITMARRRSVDRVRQRAAYQRATTRLEESTRPPVQIQQFAWTVDKEVRRHELQTAINHHLRVLPPQQSEVLKLAYLDGFSQREIAVRLALPLGTVKTRVELGVRKLSRSTLLQQVA